MSSKHVIRNQITRKYIYMYVFIFCDKRQLEIKRRKIMR